MVSAWFSQPELPLVVAIPGSWTAIRPQSWAPPLGLTVAAGREVGDAEAYGVAVASARGLGDALLAAEPGDAVVVGDAL